ncbi:MAP3K12-binding inhibitory protein 1 [Trichonephila inaurata madagascariensis]|uniref:MAP3K12-binding inhibitory protein 1 n=1 Tax=Trichonephila inaurata madagascariensis TaxID=2747483 RepID=A0A8X7C204_9ARAC|nr:MAP3K12-binding inhibitory protein 1 [Trichonephila inaurata madagascariensis]
MCDKAILSVKALLKKLRDFEVIKEFNLQPLEGNEENWNLFKSPLKTIVYELNTELASDMNTNEKETLEVQNLGIDSNNKEEKNCNRDSEENVEIQMDTAASNAKADLESQEVSNMDTNHEEKRNFDVDVESLTCNTSIRDAALQLLKLSNMNSNQEESNWKLASKDNEEIPMDTEVSNVKQIKKAGGKPKEDSDIDSNPKENKHFDVDVKDGKIQGDTETLNSDIREDAALQLLKLSDMHSNQRNKLDYRDNGEIQMDAEVSDMKTCENTDLKVQCVPDIDSISEANQSSNSNSKNNVQINITSEQMRQRVNAFKNFKRQQKNEKNVQEYCGHPYIDELNPLWGHINTCARVDAIFVPRYSIKSRYKVTRVTNRWGPQAQSSNEANQNTTEPERAPTCNRDSIVEAIQERLRSMEQHLHLNDTAKKNIFQRLKELEDRIMYLESISPDLFIQPGPDMPPPKEYINEEENLYEKYSSWSIEEIENRIKYLTEKLRAKAATKKHSPR